MATLKNILSPPALMRMVEQHPVAKRPLPYTQVFEKGDKIKAPFNRVRYRKTKNPTKLGNIGTVDAPTGSVSRVEDGFVEEDLIHINAHVDLTYTDLFGTANVNGPAIEDANVADNAGGLIARETRNLLNVAHLTREAVCSKTLQYNTFTIDKDDTDFDEGKVKVNVNYQADGGGIREFQVPAQWTDAATNIVAQLRTIWAQAVEGGHAPGHLIYGDPIIDDLLKNTEVQKWFTQQRGSMEFYKEAQVGQAWITAANGDPFAKSRFSGLGKIPSWSSWDHFFRNRSNAVTRFTNPDRATMLSADFPEHVGMAEGYSVVPVGTNAINSHAAAAYAAQKKYGLVLYAIRVGDDPGVIRLCLRWTFKPIIRNELAIWILKNLRVAP